MRKEKLQLKTEMNSKIKYELERYKILSKIFLKKEKGDFCSKLKPAQIGKKSQKTLVQAWGWLRPQELEEGCPLPGKQVNLSKLEFHFDTSLNILYV